MVGALAYPGATDGAAFRTFVIAVLLPELRRGNVLILDNLAAHHDSQALVALASAGVEVAFLPPYSPDLNPIEHTFSKVKAFLRQAAARTYDTLVTAAGAALAAVAPAECYNCLRHAGYGNKN